NQLSDLPSDIGKLTKIEGLALDNNNFRDLPKSLLDLPNLKMINIKNNPLTDKSLAIINDLKAKGVRVYE
ncbi:MAG: hypothetical protein ACXACR_16335, partial [Candidatus Hodarchaeales archaeon]